MTLRRALRSVVLGASVGGLGLMSGVSTAQESALPVGATYEVGYSSNVNAGEASALNVVLRNIQSAQRQIVVAAYEFTSLPIARALIAAHERGVHVLVLADAKENSRGFSKIGLLSQAGIPVRLAGRYAIFHNKFMVIDGETLETGSFNYTAGAADRNAENALVLHHVPDLADHYGHEWQRLWNEAG